MTTRRRNGILILAAVLPAALFLGVVVHYWGNVPNVDDWSAVAVVSAALTGHIPWHMMWEQHVDNRILIPNIGFIVVGSISHESMKAQIVVNDLLFIAAFGIFLSLFRHYASIAFRAVPVLLLGLIWFSLADLYSAIWAFQLTWYLIVFILVAMLWLLLIRGMSWPILGLAIACAVVVSYSSTQGVVLWLVGLAGILWMQPWHPSLWTCSVRWMSATWVGAAAVTMVIYFIGYHSEASNPWNLFPTQVFGVGFTSASPSYLFHHPMDGVKFYLVLLGNVVSLGPLWFRGSVGAVLLAASVIVIVRSIQRRKSGMVTYLPAALIGFGLLVNVLTVVGRSRFGLSYSLSPRYTMFNLILLMGLGVFALRYVYVSERSSVRLATGAVVVAVAVAQIATSSVGGVSGIAAQQRFRYTEARLVTTTDLVPAPERFCYRVTGLLRYGVPILSPADFEQLRRQQLTIFAPGPYHEYRSDGLPNIASCHRASK